MVILTHSYRVAHAGRQGSGHIRLPSLSSSSGAACRWGCFLAELDPAGRIDATDLARAMGFGRHWAGRLSGRFSLRTWKTVSLHSLGQHIALLVGRVSPPYLNRAGALNPTSDSHLPTDTSHISRSVEGGRQRWCLSERDLGRHLGCSARPSGWRRRIRMCGVVGEGSLGPLPGSRGFVKFGAYCPPHPRRRGSAE